MLVFATPSYSDFFYPITPAVLYPLSHLVPARAPTAHETYLRAVAEAQSARQMYLRDLEEQRLLESLRQQEALRREAEIRRQEALRLIAFRQQQARHVLARHRAARAEPALRQHSFLTPGAVAPRIVQRPPLFNARQDHLQSVQQLLGAIMGLNDELEDEKRLDEALVKQARKLALDDARARFLSKLDAIQEKAHAPRKPCAQHTQPTSTGPIDGMEYSAKIPTPFLPVPLRRRPEIPRGRERRDKAARTIQRRWRSHSAAVAARRDALRTIDVLRARFRYLRDTFAFPEHLEFRTLETARGVEPNLSYSSSNASVHKYMNELTKLLTHADGVPSGGSNTVRNARRSFVQVVEEQLEIVETRVRKVWETQGGAISERQEATLATSTSTMEPALLAETVFGSASSDLDLPAGSAVLDASNPPYVSKHPHLVDQEQPQAHPNDSTSSETPDATLHEDTHEPTIYPLDGDPVNEVPTSTVTLSESLPFHGADNAESQVPCIDLTGGADPESLSADRNIDDTPASDTTSLPEAVPVQLFETPRSVTSGEITSTASNDASATHVLDDAVDSGSAAEKFDVVYPESATPTSVSLEIDDREHDGQLSAGGSGVHSDESKGESVDEEFELL